MQTVRTQPCTFKAFTLGLCWGKCHSVERMFICRRQIWWFDVAAAVLLPLPRNAVQNPACLRLCLCFWFWCVLSLTDVELWKMPAYFAVHNPTHIGSDTAEPAAWQACDRAELDLNGFVGSITLPKHWTRHLQFPISPSWSQSPFLFTNGALIAPYLSLGTD